MIIKTKILPKHVEAITIWPFILIRPDKAKDAATLNHERIHLRQQLELLIIPFYLLYLLEAVIKNYKGISFEKEAYDNESNMNYLKQRKPFASFKYFFTILAVVLSLSASAQIVVFGVNVTPGTPVPSITISTSSLSGFETEEGTASTSQSFTVSGSNLTDDIGLKPPAGYEISFSSGSGYADTLTVTETAGTAGSTTVYARIKSTASTGSVSGNVACTSPGATTKNVALSGIVTAEEVSYALDTIQVNLYDSAGGNIGKLSISGWNDWAISLSDKPAYSAYYNWKDGTPSGIRTAWRLSNLSSGALTGVNDNGGTWGSSNTTDFPNGCFRSGSYMYSVSSGSTSSRLIINGLDDGKTYKIQVLSSRSTTQTRQTTFTYGAATQTIEAWNNQSNLVELDNLTPSSGQIIIELEALQQFSFINAFRIIQKTEE